MPEDGDAPPIRLLVPSDKVCLVIGTHGAVVQDIQRKSGARLHVDRRDAKDHPGMRYVSIHGTQKQQEDAQAEVNRILGTTAGSKEYNEDSFAQDNRSFMPGFGPFNGLFNSSVDLDTVQKMYNEQAYMYFMQPGMQPGMQQPGMQQPGMQQPGMPQPGMQPGMSQPGMPQPGMQPTMPPPGMQQPGMPQPGMPQPNMPPPGMQPGMQQPGMPQPGMPQPGMMPPGMLPPGAPQPGMPPPGMYGMPAPPPGGARPGMGGEAYPGQPAAQPASQAETSAGAAGHAEKADDDDSSPPPGFE